MAGMTPGEHSLREELVGRFRLGDFDRGEPLEDDYDDTRLMFESGKMAMVCRGAREIDV